METTSSISDPNLVLTRTLLVIVAVDTVGTHDPFGLCEELEKTGEP